MELNDSSDMTSDYVQMKIAEGEMIKEIDDTLHGYEVVVEQIIEDEELFDIIREDTEIESRGNSAKKYFKYRKYNSSRGGLREGEKVVGADEFALLLAQLNCKEDVLSICRMFDKKIDISKIEKYHKSITKSDNLSRNALFAAGFYDKSLISTNEIQKNVNDSILKTGQIICRRGKLKNNFCFYGTFDHAGIVDIRKYVTDTNYVTADLWSRIVLSAYPEWMKDSLPGDRCPEKVGYPSFEPVINFTQGKRLVLLEPINRSLMESATEYVVSRKNKCNTRYNFIDAYCSYMPYYGYKGVGINLNSDYNNSRFGRIVTPDDLYGSLNDRYWYDWFAFYIPVYGLRWFKTGSRWWNWELRRVQTGRMKIYLYTYGKVYSKSTVKTLDREQ